MCQEWSDLSTRGLLFQWASTNCMLVKTKLTSTPHQNVACSCHDISEKLLKWRWSIIIPQILTDVIKEMTKASMAYGQMGQKQSCSYVKSLWNLRWKEKFKDTKGVFRSQIEGQTTQWPKEKGQTTIYKTVNWRTDNSQKKKNKRTNNDLTKHYTLGLKHYTEN